MRELALVSERQKTPVSNLVMFCVYVQLLTDKKEWDEIVKEAPMPYKDALAASNAFFNEGWFTHNTGVFSKPGNDIHKSLPRAVAAESVPSLERKWAELWGKITGSSISGVALMGGIQRYLHSSGKALPETDEKLIRICILLRGGASIDTFLFDLGNYQAEMRATVAAEGLHKTSIERTVQDANILRTQYALSTAGKVSGNIYLFYYLALRGVIVADVVRTMQSTQGAYFAETCLKNAEIRLEIGTRGVINTDALQLKS